MTSTTLSITPRDLQIAGPTREVYWRENNDLGHPHTGPHHGELGRVAIALDVDGEGFNEVHTRADAMGIDVVAYRYAHTLVGGAFAGVAGATFTLAITPQWVDGITGGAGWIAIALVIFAFWRPELCLVGAYFFGAFAALPYTLQARGVTIAPELFQALPYVATIVVLVIVSAGWTKRRLGAPASLGVPYVREEL
jgi:simple sugar transport system permease protein